MAKQLPLPFESKADARAYLRKLADNPDVDWFQPEDMPAAKETKASTICAALCAANRALCQATGGGKKCQQNYLNCIKGCK